MARIRSVHPGLFTDDAFVSLSSDAQIFLIGLWTEADDQGVFEWKPMTLRMRLRPTKDGSVEPLLSELAASRCIVMYEVGGRKLGAVRNFRKFQRPKKPNALYPITDDIRTYVGLTEPSSELGDVQAPSGGEIPPQMKDVGCRREDEGGRVKEEPHQDSEIEDDPPRHRRQRGPYAFEQGVIRLTQVDLDRWKRAFPNLNLEGELMALAEWAGQPGQKNWFSAVSGALAKRDRNNRLAVDRARIDAAAPSRPTELFNTSI